MGFIIIGPDIIILSDNFHGLMDIETVYGLFPMKELRGTMKDLSFEMEKANSQLHVSFPILKKEFPDKDMHIPCYPRIKYKKINRKPRDAL